MATIGFFAPRGCDVLPPDRTEEVEHLRDELRRANEVHARQLKMLSERDKVVAQLAAEANQLSRKHNSATEHISRLKAELDDARRGADHPLYVVNGWSSDNEKIRDLETQVRTWATLAHRREMERDALDKQLQEEKAAHADLGDQRTIVELMAHVKDLEKRNEQQSRTITEAFAEQDRLKRAHYATQKSYEAVADMAKRICRERDEAHRDADRLTKDLDSEKSRSAHLGHEAIRLAEKADQLTDQLSRFPSPDLARQEIRQRDESIAVLREQREMGISYNLKLRKEVETANRSNGALVEQINKERAISAAYVERLKKFTTALDDLRTNIS